MGVADVQISDWYELVQGEDLEQGDILERCPVFRPPADMTWSDKEAVPDIGDIDIGLQDLVIVSQSCDIASGQKSDMWLVVLCPLWRLSAAGEVNSFLKSSYGKEECRRGNLAGYHMIAASEHDQWSREISIVSFRELWSLPLDFVRNFAASKGLRPRMKSPYREHLSQALARYFMRVGLPSEVPSFVTSDTKAEKEAVKALKKLDETALANVLSTFQPATSQTPKSAEAPNDRPGWYAWLRSVFGRRG
jgi:hypothetical protein